MKVKLKKNLPLKIFSFFMFTIFTICVIAYLPCEIYKFQPPEKFTGNVLFNPYKSFSTNWRKVNFHAHAVAWHGVTNGKQKASDILGLYKRAGYDYASISNYENVAPEDNQPGSLDVYEHGYNIHKVHQLVIMPQQVCYKDFPLIQFTSAKQFMLNQLSKNAKAVILAHPSIKNGYSNKDLKKLTGYNLMEVYTETDGYSIHYAQQKPRIMKCCQYQNKR
jgi:hypothetical protein